MTLGSSLKAMFSRSQIHLGLTAVLVLLFLPACWAAGVVPGSLGDLTFLILIAINSTCVCSLLYVISVPFKDVWEPFKTRTVRLLVLLPLGAELFWIFGTKAGFLALFDAFVLLEFFYRTRKSWSRTLLAITVPLVYFFLGFLLVYYYNDIVVAFRFYGMYDNSFNCADRWLLGGRTVSEMSKWVSLHAPALMRFAESVYLWFFGQIGIGIFFAAVEGGLSRSLKLAGTILLAYYISLFCFLIWPAQGPYLYCVDHFSTFPKNLEAYALQKSMVLEAQAIWQHTGTMIVKGDYFISFPCMHIAQPLIVLWYLRHWKRIPVVLIAYDIVLVAAILLLEWHYFVDILGGIAIAAGVIWITEGNSFKTRRPQPSIVEKGAGCLTESVT